MNHPVSIIDASPEVAAEILLRFQRIDAKEWQRFFEKIKKVSYDPAKTIRQAELPGDCWQWVGAIDDGWGDCKYPKMKHKGKTWRVHRWIVAMLIRPIGVWEDVDHMCENSLCVNPSHLRICGTKGHSNRPPPANWDGQYVMFDPLEYNNDGIPI